MNDEFQGFLRPRSRQRVLATPERSHCSSRESAVAHDHELSTMNGLIESQAVTAPIRAAPVVDDSNSVFDKLRGAMKGGDTNLFALLHIALAHLVKMGHSKVSSLDLT